MLSEKKILDAVAATKYPTITSLAVKTKTNKMFIHAIVHNLIERRRLDYTQIGRAKILRVVEK